MKVREVVPLGVLCKSLFALNCVCPFAPFVNNLENLRRGLTFVSLVSDGVHTRKYKCSFFSLSSLYRQDLKLFFGRLLKDLGNFWDICEVLQ